MYFRHRELQITQQEIEMLDNFSKDMFFAGITDNTKKSEFYDVEIKNELPMRILDLPEPKNEIIQSGDLVHERN